jgi:RNA polymerase sigma-70 factor (ECF subfamily)
MLRFMVMQATDMAAAANEPSDEALMALVAEGDERAFRRLAARHTASSLRLAGRMTGSVAEAEDVVQEALLRVWRAAHRWRPSAAFRTWLYRIVVNLCIDRARRPSFAPLDAAGDPADPAPGPAAALEAGRTARQVAVAIAELPERQRIALVLTYYEGLGNEETARVLGTSVGGVESLLVRARRSLKTRLAGLLGDGSNP